MRTAFDDLTISRGIIVVEGDHVARQTTMAGTFVREFTQSPIGPIPPNGRQTDNRSRLRQLGVGDR